MGANSFDMSGKEMTFARDDTCVFLAFLLRINGSTTINANDNKRFAVAA